MTAKEAYTYTLVEINKLEAPSLLLEDFNYLFNKAVQQYINKCYNRYEINQQSTDDLRALKVTSELTVYSKKWGDMFDTEEYYCELPSNYLHILNCIVKFNLNAVSDQGCNKTILDTTIVPAKKLTSNIYPSILTNAYLKPSVKNPYFFINTRTVPTNPKTPETNEPNLVDVLEGFDSTPESNNNSEKTVNVLELKCGDVTYYTPNKIYIDYIKTPTKIELTESQLEYITDTSQKLEFPDYVCYEIINEVTKLILENSSDPRLQTNIPINQTIGLSNK